MKVFLDYKFIFEPDGKVRNLETFERMLADVFKQMGYEAENVRTVDEELCKIVFLKPIENKEEPVKEQIPASKTLDKLAKKKYTFKTLSFTQ